MSVSTSSIFTKTNHYSTPISSIESSPISITPSSVVFKPLPPKPITASVEKIDLDDFPKWILTKQKVIDVKKKWAYPKGTYTNKSIEYDHRVKFWKTHPAKAVAENLKDEFAKTKPKTIDEVNIRKDYTIFIHLFPDIFNFLLGSAFSAYTRTEHHEKQDPQRDHFMMMCHINRKAHTYEKTPVGEQSMKGWLVYSIGTKSKVCFHKCFTEKTPSRPYGNAFTHGWKDTINLLEKEKVSFPDGTCDYEHLLDKEFKDIQIFYSSYNQVISIVDMDQTTYQIKQIFT